MRGSVGRCEEALWGVGLVLLNGGAAAGPTLSLRLHFVPRHLSEGFNPLVVFIACRLRPTLAPPNFAV